MRRQRNLLGPQAMGGMVSLWGASSLIRSVQSGSIDLNAATSATATIASVNVNNAMCVFRGSQSPGDAGAVASDYYYSVRLTNATTVTAATNTSSGTSRLAYYLIVEFSPGVLKSVQRGVVTITGFPPTGTAAIATVDTSRSIVSGCGFTSSYTTSPPMYANRMGMATELTNATTVTVFYGTAEGNRAASWEVLEFF